MFHLFRSFPRSRESLNIHGFRLGEAVSQFSKQLNIVRKLLEISVRPEFIEGFLRTARSYFDQAQH